LPSGLVAANKNSRRLAMNRALSNFIARGRLSRPPTVIIQRDRLHDTRNRVNASRLIAASARLSDGKPLRRSTSQTAAAASGAE